MTTRHVFLVVFLSGATVSPAPVSNGSVGREERDTTQHLLCARVRAMVNDTVTKTLNVINVICKHHFLRFPDLPECNQTAQDWGVDHPDHSRLTQVHPSQHNTTSVLRRLHSGLHDHVALLKMVFKTLTHDECPLPGAPPAKPSATIPVDRKSQEYCGAMEDGRTGLGAAYSSMNNLQHALFKLLESLSVAGGSADWEPYTGWTETSDLESYYLLSLLNAYQQALLTGQVLAQHPACTP